MVHRAQRRSFWFGVTSAVISGVVGLLILVTEKTDAPPWLHIAAGGVSILASVITAIATSGKWSEKAAQHHAAGAAYGNLHRRIEHALAVPPPSDEAMSALLEELRQEQDSLPMNAPPIPEKVWNALPQEIYPSAYEPPTNPALDLGGRKGS